MPSLPSNPGVYWFQDRNKKIIYVGKAKNLKNRIFSYKQINQLFGKTKKLVETAQKLSFKIVDTEIDALIIEAELINLHQPKFNIQLKDDKSPLYLYFTNEPIPKIKTTRISKLHSIKKSDTFGPFSSSYELKKLITFTRKTFLFCHGTNQQIAQKKACFYYHLHQCPGICVGEMTPEAYRAHLQVIKLFLRGKKRQIISDLKRQINYHARNLEFEQADHLKHQVKTLSLKTLNLFDHNLPILSNDITQEGIKLLRKIIRKFISLPPNYPLTRIEGYDISNIQGKWATGSMVVFTNGKSDHAEYRKFKINTKSTPDDPYMMAEMLGRRLKHEEWGIPQLMVIDGGKTQLSAAQNAISWNIPIISLVKRPERLMFKIDGKYYAIPLEENPAATILRRIRDESHRFAKTYHKRLTINI